MSKRQCMQCNGWYDPIFFESIGHLRGVHTSYRSAVCKGCAQTNRDGQKAHNRWRSKMRNTRKSHAQKFNISESDLENVYKWRIEQMEHDARHAYENGCPNCGHTFAEMGHGLADITLDIIVREAAPIYGNNTRWICHTCNRQKGKYTMKEYSTLMVEWQRWKRQTDNRWANTLLDGMKLDFGSKPLMEYRRRGER